MPPVAAIAGGIGSLLGGAAAGVGGLVAGAGSAIAGTAGLGLSALGGITSGVGSLFAPATAAGVTVSQQMASIAEPAFYETAGAGVLGGIPSAISGTVDYLGNLMPSAMGVYKMIKPQKPITPVPAARTVPSVPAPAISGMGLPVLGAQPSQPSVVLSTGMPAKPETNYILYIGLAILALFLFRKK